MSYDVGDLVTLQTVVRNDAGTPVNTPTVTIAATKPDGTLVDPAPTVTNTGAGGIYTAQVTATAAGVWTYVWTSSGTVVGTDSGQITVYPARALVASLEELKGWLRHETTREDERLKELLRAVTDLMEPAVGPVSVRSFTERVLLRNATMIRPKRRPLASVTSLTPDQGAALPAADYVVDTDASVVWLRYGGSGLYTLVYAAGHNPWPAALKWAAQIICQHEWAVRNGNGGRPSPDMDALAILPGSGYLVPNRALELMRDYLPALAA